MRFHHFLGNDGRFLQTSGKWRGAASLGVALLAACGPDAESDKQDDVDITDNGNFDGGDSSGGGSTGGSGDGTLDDGGGDGAGTGGSTGSGTTGGTTDGGGSGGVDDGGWDGGSGSVEPDLPDHGPEDVACEGELSYQLLVVDSASGVCSVCAADADIWIVPVLYNPCDTELSYTLYDGMLLSSLDMSNATTGEGMGMGVGSTGSVETGSLAPGEWMEEPTWVGMLSRGDWTVNISFKDMESHRASAAFTVE